MTLTYVRNTDGSFSKSGEVKTRRVYVRVLKNDVWSVPMAPLNRVGLVAQIEAELLKGAAAKLTGDAYELTEIQSEMTEETKEKLKNIGKELEEEA